MRVVVVGAGITGLAAAHATQRARPDAEVVVLEASDRVGGKIRTTTFAGRPVDCAADAFLARAPEAVALCHELGLTDDLVTPASRTAYVFARGALRPFPPGLVLGVPTDIDALSRAGVVSDQAVARAAQDLTLPEPPRTGDESVGSLVRRRVGDEVYETLVAPLLSGVYAGDADDISAAVAAPQFVTALRDHGSLIAGLRAQAATSAVDAPVFYGLRNGTQTLVDALAASITEGGGTMSLATPVERIEHGDSGLRVVSASGSVIDAPAVVVTTPDHVTAGLLDASAPVTARELRGVPYASVVVVTLEVAREALADPLDGSGFLVPTREPFLLTACSWSSSKWAHLDGDTILLRASAGRYGDDRALVFDDDALVERLTADLRDTMGLGGPPLAWRVTRWPAALPQFPPGHLERVAAWRDELAVCLPGLLLAGAGIGGLGIPACIRQADEAVASLPGTAPDP